MPAVRLRENGDGSRRRIGAIITPLALVLSSAFVLASCGSAGSRKQIDESAQAVASWAATVELVTLEWVRGALPSRYTRDAIRKAQEQVHSAEESLAQISPEDTLAARAAAHYRQVDRYLTTLASDVARGDQRAAGELVSQLSDEAKSLREVHEQSARQQ